MKVSNNDKACSNCKHFGLDDRPTNRGTCALGRRGGVTYGQYICTLHEPISYRGGDLVPGRPAKKRDKDNGGDHKPVDDAGDPYKKPISGDDKAKTTLADKGVNYDR